MSKEKLKSEAVVELQQAVTVMRDIVAGMEKQGVVLQHDGESMGFRIPDLVGLEIEAKKKDGKNELSIEIKWKEGMEKGDPLGVSVVSPDDPAYGECLRTELPAQEQPTCAET